MKPREEVILGGKPFGRRRLFLIAGPCVLETPELGLRVAEHLAELAARLDLPVLFKASFDKANRTSLDSFRGPGLEQGLEAMARIKAATGLPVISDVHQPGQAAPAAQVLDVLQIPAFLCRQTDLLVAAAATGRPVNVKKGQFVAPHDMAPVVQKILGSGNDQVWLTERGSSFGYNNLVVDMRGFKVMAATGCPVIMDATHSVQLPGGLGHASGGDRGMVPLLARAAVAAGAHGVFLEVHPQPDQALCDGPNSLALEQVEPLVRQLLAIHQVSQQAHEQGE
ncbi:MAG: 3-deoxy-8-phosphooctulonate synthase [Deltaproteobacteria bacterium]|nr:3-deoxy-8-phosphooctulonate synthase [Deltaproteobacteria bacterium]